MNITNVNVEDLMEIAKRLKARGLPWHFHMLGKTCRFNTNPGKFCLFLEDEKGKRAFSCAFDEKPMAHSKQLADLMYGQGFTDAIGNGGKKNKDFAEILKRADDLTARGVEWHHHLTPNCTFNENRGKHVLVLEDPESGKTLMSFYDRKPVGDLAKIEKLFYKKL